MKKALLILCLFSFFASGCVSSQPQKTSANYSLDGKWQVKGVGKNGNFEKIDIGEDLEFVFDDGKFDILLENNAANNEFDLDDIRYSLLNGMITLKSQREKLTANIEFFGPNEIRCQISTATRKASIMILSLKAAITGILIDRSNDWIDNYVYFSKVGAIQKASAFNTNSTQINNGIFYDKKTGLMWAARDNGEPINRNDAAKFCKTYKGGGFTDWRLPTLEELASLYNKKESYQVKGKDYKVYKTEGITLTGGWIIASETFGVSSGYVYSFTDGSKTFGLNSATHKDVRVLPVRSANGFE